MKYNFKIEGLDCANCAEKLERSINKVEGVNKATISFITQKMIIELDEENKNSIMKEIKKVIKKEEPDVTIEEV